MSQTSVNATRVLHQHRVAMIAGLSLALAAQSGCATARRWPSKSHESAAPIVKSEPTVEPAMAANVAVKTEPVAESDSNEALVSNVTRPNSQSARQGARTNRFDFRPRDNQAIPESKGFDESDSDKLVETERPDSSMERLTAALADDAVYAQSLPQQSLTALEARGRVDSLLSQAKQLREVGQLDQARQTALLAQELGESAHLDFSPDEDRPIDLIRQIDRQLGSPKITGGPHLENDTVESSTKPLEPQTPDSVTKSATPPVLPGKDALGLAKIRRDWSTLFRREKKPAGPEANVAGLASKQVILAPAMEVRTNELQASHSSEAGQRDAIVMANRSVSLAPPDRDASSSFAAVASDSIAADEEPGRALISAQGDFDNLDVRDIRSGPTKLIAAPSSVISPADDAAAIPEFEVGEAVIPVQDIEVKAESPAESEDQECSETRQSNWILLYVIFGVCSLMALGCYRRGAT